MRFQDLPFLEKLAGAEPLWFLMTEGQKKARIRHVNKFCKVIKCKHHIMLEFNNDNYGLKIFLGTIDTLAINS